MLFFHLTRQRENAKTVSKKFYQSYISYLKQRNSLNPTKYIFYRSKNITKSFKQSLLFYEIDHFDGNFIYFKGKRRLCDSCKHFKEVHQNYSYNNMKCKGCKNGELRKVKILFNKFGIVYSKFQNNYIYLYEKKFKEEILKKKCDRCKRYLFFYECGILNEFCEVKQYKKEPFIFVDPFDFLKLDIELLYCKHNFCESCIEKLTVIHLQKSLNSVHRTLIVKSK